jgi:hypothetical protein
VGLNEKYRLRQTGRLVRGRTAEQPRFPASTKTRQKKAAGTLCAPGSTAVCGALRALPEVRGIALGAFSEFSEFANLMIEGLAR